MNVRHIVHPSSMYNQSISLYVQQVKTDPLIINKIGMVRHFLLVQGRNKVIYKLIGHSSTRTGKGILCLVGLSAEDLGSRFKPLNINIYPSALFSTHQI